MAMVDKTNSKDIMFTFGEVVECRQFMKITSFFHSVFK